MHLELSKNLVVNKLSATLNGRNLSIDTSSKVILIDEQEHRENVKFSYNGLALKSKNKDKDKIKLSLTLWGLLKLNIKPILLVAGIALLFFMLVSCALILFKGIDIKGYFAKVAETECFDPDRVDNDPPVTSIIVFDTITADQRLYNELDSILKIQRVQWNYKDITTLVEKYDHLEVTNPEHKAYKLYKELAWMQCRRRLNGDGCNGDYKQWIRLINEKGIICSNKEFATEELYDFLTGIVKEKNKEKQKQFFEKYVKTKQVEMMTFDKVKNTWNSFTPEQPEYVNPTKQNQPQKPLSAE